MTDSDTYPGKLYVLLCVHYQNFFSVITVRLLENSVDVTEATTNTQICVNVTQGIVESSAHALYSTLPGSASCK